MILILTTDFVLVVCTVAYMWMECRSFFRTLRQKSKIRSVSGRFTRHIQTLFELPSPMDAVDFLQHKNSQIANYIEMVLAMHAPELSRHAHKYLWVLLARKKLLADPSELTQRCHQHFMCVVMQLRMFGELRDMGAMKSFQQCFGEFVLQHAVHEVAQRTWALAIEMRSIAQELDEIVDLEPQHTELINRFSNALRGVRELIQ
jgi:hypothetical protein